jgi:hypothetical protein
MAPGTETHVALATHVEAIVRDATVPLSAQQIAIAVVMERLREEHPNHPLLSLLPENASDITEMMSTIFTAMCEVRGSVNAVLSRNPHCTIVGQKFTYQP